MRSAALRALLAALLFGAAAPACKPLLDHLSAPQLAGLLYLGAALGVLPAALRRAPVLDHARGTLPRAAWLPLAGIVLAGGIAGPLLLLAALARAEAASVSLLLQLELPLTALLGVALFREHLGTLGWIGVGGAAAAGALLGTGSGWPGAVAALLTAAACACWALDNQLAATLDQLSPVSITLVKGLVAGATNLGAGLVLAPLAGSPQDVVLALGVGALGYGASIVLLVSAAQSLGATRAGALFASAPFVGAGIAFLVLGEPLLPRQAGAAVLLVASAMLLLRTRHEHAHRHAAVKHVHAHRHDDGQHEHAHPGVPPGTWHTHWHRHEPVTHAHTHAADLHHRHEH